MPDVITTDDEVEDLREWQREMAAEMACPWEPACIAVAFATARAGDLVMTMQTWIDLERARSPILAGHSLETNGDLLATAEVFGLELRGLSVEDTALCAISMERAGREAFSLCLKMRPPAGSSDGRDDGFGTWLPLMAFLMKECGMSRAEAGAMAVREAFALLAAVRRNDGWDVAGEPYATREQEGRN